MSAPAEALGPDPRVNPFDREYVPRSDRERDVMEAAICRCIDTLLEQVDVKRGLGFEREACLLERMADVLESELPRRRP